MIPFPFLEPFGVTAIMSDRHDGDCRTRERGEAFLLRDDVSLHHPLHLLNQVHSATLLEALPEHQGCEADGLYTQDTTCVLGIRIADCVPVFLFDPRQRAGALVHAGRAGTFQGIAAKAVQSLHRVYNSLPSDIRAVIGPSAGPCCYEVSEEMAQEFSEGGGIAQGRHLDLWQSNQTQLLQEGLVPEHIQLSEICTICSDQFHSYRSNAPTARNIAVLHIHEDH